VNVEDLYDLKRKLMILKHAAEPLLDATPGFSVAGCLSSVPACTIISAMFTIIYYD
jgi:hypothetical protein